MKIHDFKQAEQFLNLHIPQTSQQKFSGEIGLERTKNFLFRLENPQEKLKIIHVAGTSGKGSTCYLISSLLVSQGFKVGFHQSPHLTDVRERFQINNQIISKKEFVFYLNKIIPMIDRTDVINHVSTKLSYFEILVGLAFYIFAEKKVDYAVIETGMGGKYDGTNVVERSDKLAVITKIGLDHTNILGKTLKEIAIQKALIINKFSQVISTKQKPVVEKVIKQIAKSRQATYNLRGYASGGYVAQNLGLLGDYQRENAALALTAVKYLSQRDRFKIDEKKVEAVFQTAHFPGRFDIKNINGKTIIFDGAHNPQKMKAFISALIQKYPGMKFNFLLAFKSGKDYKKMLKTIISETTVHKIIITSFFTDNQELINLSEKPEKVGQSLKRIGFNNFEINSSVKNAWENILKKKEPIVVTGSLYLIGEIYRLIKIK